jgi:hypothetical protein
MRVTLNGVTAARATVTRRERPSTRPETIRGLTDRELERELTLATLTSRRQHRFDLLLSERHRRIRRAGDLRAATK